MILIYASRAGLFLKAYYTLKSVYVYMYSPGDASLDYLCNVRGAFWESK